MKRTGIHAFDWRRASAAAVDVLIALVFLFSLTVTVLTVSARSTGRTAGGFTLGIVQSGSMEASGIEIGDVMSIRRQSGYAVGDVIAFYRAPDAYAGTADEAELTNARIWIHEIIDVRTDEAGRETYLTKGTSNASDDKYYVPADFVVGRGTPLPSALNGFLRFAIADGRGCACYRAVRIAARVSDVRFNRRMRKTQEANARRGRDLS